MARVIFVNGRYQLYQDSCVHVEDRGFQFADGVYEVCEVRGSKLVDETRHMMRLERSMHELKISSPMSLKSLGVILRETVRRNKVVNGLVYIQITRGVARRDFVFPSSDIQPTIVCFARKVSPEKNDAKSAKGLHVITMPDIRWKRPDIKSISLLPNALARQAAKEQGAEEAWLVDEHGYITEGAASNAWIVTQDNVLVTRSAETGILRGITRSVVIDLLKREGIEFREQAFKVEDVIQAKEAFITSASNVIMPIVTINGDKVGQGTVGPVTSMLRKEFHSQAELSS